MSDPKFPPGWDATRVQKLIDAYESQSDDEAVAEDEETLLEPSQTLMEIPLDLVPAVRALIATRGKVA